MNHIATRYFLGLVKMPWKLSWEFAVEFSYIKSDNSIKSSLKHKIVNLIGCKIESKTKKKKKKDKMFYLDRAKHTCHSLNLHHVCIWDSNWKSTLKVIIFLWFEWVDLSSAFCFFRDYLKMITQACAVA